MLRFGTPAILPRALLCWCFGFFSLIGIIAAPAAQAQSRLSQLSQALANDPENFDLMWVIAAEASSTGRYDEAIQALELLLIYFPQDPNVRVELGIMYFRLGAFETSARQFEIAKGLGLTASQTATVSDFESKLEFALLGIEQEITLTPTIGYADNAAGASREDTVYYFGNLIPAEAFKHRSRTGVQLNYAVQFKPDSPNGEAFSFRAVGNAGRSIIDLTTADVWPQFQNSNRAVDNFSVKVESEALYPIGVGFSGLALRGIGSGSISRLESQAAQTDIRTYSAYAGIRQDSADSTIDLGGRYYVTEARTQDLSNPTTAPVGAPGRKVYSGELNLVHRLDEKHTLDLSTFIGFFEGADRPTTDISGLKMGWTISEPFADTSWRTLRFEYAQSNSKARASDPSILPGTPMRTTQYKFSATQTYSIGENYDAVIAISQSSQESNIPNGRVDDWQVTLAVPFRF